MFSFHCFLNVVLILKLINTIVNILIKCDVLKFEKMSYTKQIYVCIIDIRNIFKNQCDIFLIMYNIIFLNALSMFEPTIILSVKCS